MKLLGIDQGSVRHGLAVSDPDGKFAFPLSVYKRRNEAQDAEFFRSLCSEEKIGMLVVGLPIHTNGEEGVKAREARAFGAWLAQVCGLPVRFWDERFTTAAAESALWEAGLTHKQRRARRDKVAAQMLLQTYLDAGCPAEWRAVRGGS